MLLLLAVTVVQRTVGLGRGVLFCRWLTPESLGQWEMAYSFLLLAAPLAVLGVPGSYGRYLEHYRQRGHLRTFLRRTTVWTAVCGAAAVTIVVGFAGDFSSLVFGDAAHANLIRGIALCLAAVILHHTLTSLLTALRLFRVVTAMNFAQSTLFAGLALGLLYLDATVSSILIGYGVGCLIASLGTIAWVWPALRDVEHPPDHIAQREFWPRLMRFAFFVWLTNLLAHLFAIVDRYMIVHYSGMASSEALEQVGHYHSSRIVPLLLISFADLLSGLIMPHLSHDWEAGRRKEVGQQLKLTVKLTALGMFAFGVFVLVFAPLLFDVVLEGKYSTGLVVLPWTMAACVWYGTYFITQNFLWCAEKTRLASATLALGLAVNIALNLMLLPIWGLAGAVIATAISTLICLSAILLLSRREGMPVDRGIWILVVAPLALTVGTTFACIVGLILVAVTFSTQLILDPAEHERLRQLRSTLLPLLRRRLSSAGNA